MKNCAEINASEDRVVNQQKEHRMVYQCKKCNEQGGVNPYLAKVIQELTQQINTFKTLTKDIKDNKFKVKEITSTILPKFKKEIQDDLEKTKVEVSIEAQQIIKKSRNIIIHGTEVTKSKKKDITIVKNVLEKLEIQYNNNYFKRIGKVTVKDNKNFRSILLELDSDKQVFKAMSNKKKLDNGISIMADRTELQRKLLQEAYNQRDARKEAGEEDLVVKYVKGIPTVIKINNDSKNGNTQEIDQTT